MRHEPDSDIKSISVVMCTYNGETYLKEQLDSILNQTYPTLEVIIQDDGSTDNTIEIIKEYQKKHPIIRFEQNKHKKGINANFFSGIEKAKGEYIAIADQDDIWVKEKLEIQINHIGDKYLCSGFSKPFCQDKDIKVHFDERIPNYGIERLIYIGALPGHTQLFKKTLFNLIPDIQKWEKFFLYDHILQMVAACYESIAFCNNILVYQRRHIQAVTYKASGNHEKSFLNILQMFKKAIILHRDLKKEMSTYFKLINNFLNSIPANTTSQRDAIKISLYHSQSNTLSFIKLCIMSIRLGDRLFYTKSKKFPSTILRSLFFPILCCNYFPFLRYSNLE